MSWQPQNQVIDEKKLIDNLLSFFRANQSSALDWAAGGVGALKDFARLHNSATGRVDTVFPVLMISSTRLVTTFDSDLLEAAWFVEIELAVAAARADEATEKSHKYVQAVESMLANIPSGTLCAGSRALQFAALERLSSEFDVLRRRSANEFLQIAVIGAEFTLRAASY
jgi:hypothetical protein